MNKNIVFALFGCLLFISGFAQTNEINKFLSQVALNNIKLKAYKSYIESRQLVNKTSNNLPDPQLSAYYMPFGNNDTTDYTEYQISQSLEFPTVYSSRAKWNNLKETQLNNNYAELRQSILLKAQKLIIELISLQNKQKVTVVRQDQSKKIYDQIQELYRKEQVGILDLNKSKIIWIQEQFSVEQIVSEIQIITTTLEKINGDNPIDFKNQKFEYFTQVDDLEKTWELKLEQDPTLKNLKVNEEASLQQLKLEKNKVLPNLTIGYNYQGVSGNNYAGLFGGISVPLWNSKNKVKAAEANYKYHQTNAVAEIKTLFSEYQQQYNRYLLLLKKYTEFKVTMDSLNSETLLYKAYSLGEYSFREYYQEIQFYRVSYNKMLQMEKEVQLLKADLLKHQL